jgi:hypothetical protein
MLNVDKVRLFPTLIYFVDCPQLINPVKREFKKSIWKDDSVTTNDTFFTLQNNKNLVQKIEKIVNDALSEIKYVVPLKMTTSWFTRVLPGKEGRNHYHVNSFWSAIFYFQDNNSKLVVAKELPQITVPWLTEDLGLMPAGDVGLDAKKGQMILIPGNIRHYIQENKNSTNRNSLAMNFMPSGFCHFEDSSYNYK